MKTASPVKTEDIEGYVGVREVARFLNKTPNFVYENSHPSLSRPMPCLRRGKYLFFKLSQVERWLLETAEKI